MINRLIGAQGYQGAGGSGSLGAQGTQGLMGSQGLQGLQGIIGVQGFTGAQGLQGLQGIIGVQGTTGLQGALGVQGTTGLQGLNGTTGLQGAQGLTGVQGSLGAQGSLGVQGTIGAQGNTGFQGSLGVQGTVGSQGFQGITGTFANPSTTNLDMNTHSISNVVDPTNPQDASTKNYVDTTELSLNPPQSVVAATTAALTATYNNGTAGVSATLTNAGTLAAFSIDGISPAVGSRVLIKNQATSFYNGVYFVVIVGSGATNWVLRRYSNFNSPTNISNSGVIPVSSGTVNINTSWFCSSLVTTVGSDAIIFAATNSSTFLCSTLVQSTPSALEIYATGAESIAFTANIPKLVNFASRTFVQNINPKLDFTFNTTTGQVTYNGTTKYFRVNITCSALAGTSQSLSQYFISKNGSSTLTTAIFLNINTTMYALINLSRIIQLTNTDTLQLGGQSDTTESLSHGYITYTISQI